MADNVIEFLIKGNSSDAQKAFGDLEGSLGKLTKAFTIAAVAAAAVEFSKKIGEAIDLADKTGKLAQRTGTTAESFSQLSRAFELSDVSGDELGQSLQLLNRNINEAVTGNDAAAESFASLGLSLNDLKSKSPDQVMLDLADAFSKSSDGAAKTAAAMQFFGRSGAQMIPALNQGREGIEQLMHQADQLGLTVGKQFAAEAERFNDSMKMLSQAGAGVTMRLASEMLPTLNATVDAIKDVLSTGESSLPWGKVFSGAIAAVSIAFVSLIGVVKEVYTVVSGFLNAWGNAIGGIAAAAAQALSGDLSGAAETAKTAWSESGAIMGNALTEAGKTAQATDASIKKIFDSLGDVNNKTNELGQSVDKVNKNPLNFVSKEAAARLEELHNKQNNFINDLSKREAAASDNKLALLNSEYSAQITKMDQLKMAGEQRTQAMNQLDRWYADERFSIETDMLNKLGVTDEEFRARKQELVARDAQRMRELGLTEQQIDTYTKSALLQQQMDFQAAKSALVDEQYLLDSEKSAIQYENDLLQLQMALEQRLITEDQYRAYSQQAETQHQARLGNIFAQAEANRTAVAKMNWLGQLKYAGDSLGSISALMSSESKTQFQIGKAAAIAQATIAAISSAVNAYNSASAIPIVGWILGPVAAAAAIAAGMANVSKIKSTQFSGQAHAGMTNVPNEGTFLLDKGERVLSPEQNKDLTGFLNGQGGAGGGDSTVVQTPAINIYIQGDFSSMSDADLEEQVAGRLYRVMNNLDRKGVRPDFVQRQRAR